MATLPNVTIPVVPPEAPEDPDFPALDPINTFNLVGPTAANRQPNALKTRDFTLRDRVNLLVANMNEISTGEGSAVLFLPRDGTNPMTGDLSMGSKKITNLAAGTVDSDVIRKDQVVENRLWPTPTGTPLPRPTGTPATPRVTPSATPAVTPVSTPTPEPSQPPSTPGPGG